MDIGLIAGIGGLAAAAVAMYVMLYAFGYFQYLGGKKPSRLPPANKNDLMDRILALNDPSRPYQITKNTESDLVPEWKIVDAKWYGVLNRNGLREAYRAFLFLDEGRHSVRCYEELGSISWTAGLDGARPTVSYSRSFVHGRILYSSEHPKGYGIKQLSPPDAGTVYDYKFEINEIRGPIILTVEQNGWEWVPVTAKRHATHEAA